MPPFLTKPIPGFRTLCDEFGRVRMLPSDYEQRRRLLRRAKRGDRAAVSALWLTYRVTVMGR